MKFEQLQTATLDWANDRDLLNSHFSQTRVIGFFYNVNIIGTGTLLLKWGFHKYDFLEKEPCFLTDEGYKVNESDYDSFVFAF